MRLYFTYVFFVLFLLPAFVFGQNVGIGTAIPDYTLDVDGQVGINDYIYHNNDGGDDAFFGFPDNDQLIIQLGGKQVMSASTNALTVNPLQADVDFSVAGDSYQHLFHIDTENDKVGIGASLPTYLLDISGGDVRVAGDSYQHLFFIDSSLDRIGIGNGEGNPSYLLDISGGDVRVAGDSYQHLFYVNSQNDRVGIATDDPQYTLDVEGDINSSSLSIDGHPVFSSFQSGETSVDIINPQELNPTFIVFDQEFATTPRFLAIFRTASLTPDVIVNVNTRVVTNSYAEIYVYRIDSNEPVLGGLIDWIAWEED